MKCLRSRLIFLIVLALSCVANAQPGEPAGRVPAIRAIREDAVAIAQAEVDHQISSMLHDDRYTEVQKRIQNQKLHFDLLHTSGLTFPAEGKTFFIPVLDERGNESGFLSINEELWALSLRIESDRQIVLGGFSIRIDQTGMVVMEQIEKEISSAPTCSDAKIAILGAETIIPRESGVTSCSYVSSTGFSIGCFALPDNPLGAYYVQTYRYGTTPDPLNPSWWACYQGYIHVCPRYENPGSPYNFPTCGYAPNHPAG